MYPELLPYDKNENKRKVRRNTKMERERSYQQISHCNFESSIYLQGMGKPLFVLIVDQALNLLQI